MSTLTDWLELPSSLGGSNLNSLACSADKEFLGPFAGIEASLIAFYRKTELPVYASIVRALEGVGDAAALPKEETPPSADSPCASSAAVKAVAERVTTTLPPLTDEELTFATQLIRGHYMVEVPGKWTKLGDASPDIVVLPEPRTLWD